MSRPAAPAPASAPDTIEGWSTQNTKLAAVFAGLGFVVSTRVNEMLERNSQVRVRFFIEAISTRNRLQRDLLRSGWENGQLAAADPLHPFLVGMVAVTNYERLMRMQAQGERHRLVAVPGGWEYRRGEEDSTMTLARELVATRDVCLAAALGAVGVPVVRIDGEPGQRRYCLPKHGLDPTQRETGLLIRRAGPNTLDLELERSEPQHPLCAAYQATFALSKLNAHLKGHARTVVLKAPGTKRRALVMENATNRVLDKVRRHFGVPDD